jgi:hypothetical protein
LHTHLALGSAFSPGASSNTSGPAIVTPSLASGSARRSGDLLST